MNKKFLLSRIPRFVPVLFLIGGFIGFVDSSYLSVLHYKNVIPPCSILGECEKVLTSRYALVWGVPTALFGAFYYLSVVILSVLYLDTKRAKYLTAAMGAITVGFVFTLWFLYLQAFVIKAFCEYCLLSAGITSALFIMTVTLFVINSKKEYI
ncbi:MAG: vitamin K epoxide reductase family protein [Patescibacteria group bacterium]